MSQLVGKFYQFSTSTALGSRAKAYIGRHIITGRKVIVKVEHDPEHQRDVIKPTLPFEAAVYKCLGPMPGIASMRWDGRVNDWNVLVTEKLGPDLDMLKKFCLDRLSLKTVMMLADQMIHRIQAVHSRGLVYRDVKPENFAMGNDHRSHIVHLFDFGLAKPYIDPRTGKHVPYNDDRLAVGTFRYFGSNVHKFIEPTRRDDMEGLGITLLYLLRERLPWEGIFARTEFDKFVRTGEMKTFNSKAFNKLMDELEPSAQPAFRKYFEHCAKLNFEERPDYDFLRSLFKGVMEANKWEYDYKYDWTEDGNPPGGSLRPEKYHVRPFAEFERYY